MRQYKSAGSIYHAQEAGGFCGAAAALTMLSDADMGVKVGGLREESLHDEARNGSIMPWEIDPYRLTAVLNDHVPQAVVRRFKLVEEDKEPVVTGYIVGAVGATGAVAPAVALYDESHWVTINQVDLEVDVASGTYKLLRIWFYDPEPLNNPPEETHSDQDRCPDLGDSHQSLCYPSGWIKAFGKVCLGDVEKYIAIMASGVSSAGSPGTVEPPSFLPVRDPTGLIISSSAVELCRKWLSAYGAYAPGTLADHILDGAEPDDPTLVTWTWSENRVYLLTLKKGEEIVGSAIMDGYSGALLSIKAYQDGSPAREFLKRLPGLKDSSRWIWLPCRESLSPHRPFRMLEDGKFERLDGRIFGRLTAGLKGA